MTPQELENQKIESSDTICPLSVYFNIDKKLNSSIPCYVNVSWAAAKFPEVFTITQVNCLSATFAIISRERSTIVPKLKTQTIPRKENEAEI